METPKIKKILTNDVKSVVDELNTLKAIWEEIDRQIKQGNKHNAKIVGANNISDDNKTYQNSPSNDVIETRKAKQNPAELSGHEEED